MALNIKKGDTVLVIAGKDKGKSGKVLVAMPADNSVVVAGVNIIAKHKKPRSANDKGGIIKKEGKIDASNVQIICPACNKATRISHKHVNNEKIRECKKCGANLDASVKKETKKATTTKKETSAPAKKETAKKEVKEVKEVKAETKAPAKKTTTAKTEASTATEKKAPAKTTSTKKSTSTKKVESK